MNITNLNKAAELARQPERLERTIAAYREAERINVTITVTFSGGSRMPDYEEQYRVEMTAAEIGDAVVEALERRLAKMVDELRSLGVVTGEAAGAGAK